MLRVPYLLIFSENPKLPPFVEIYTPEHIKRFFFEGVEMDEVYNHILTHAENNGERAQAGTLLGTKAEQVSSLARELNIVIGHLECIEEDAFEFGFELSENEMYIKIGNQLETIEKKIHDLLMS